jgi:hypothetical protein
MLVQCFFHGKHIIGRTIYKKRTYVAGLKEPGSSAILLVLTPPSQTDQETSRDIFNGPKVEDEKQHTEDKDQYKVVREPSPEKVGADRSNAEQEVEDQAHRMATMKKDVSCK